MGYFAGNFGNNWRNFCKDWSLLFSRYTPSINKLLNVYSRFYIIALTLIKNLPWKTILNFREGCSTTIDEDDCISSLHTRTLYICMTFVTRVGNFGIGQEI